MTRDPRVYLDPAEWRCTSPQCDRASQCSRAMAEFPKYGASSRDYKAERQQANPWSNIYFVCDELIPLGQKPAATSTRRVHPPIGG